MEERPNNPQQMPAFSQRFYLFAAVAVFVAGFIYGGLQFHSQRAQLVAAEASAAKEVVSKVVLQEPEATLPQQDSTNSEPSQEEVEETPQHDTAFLRVEEPTDRVFSSTYNNFKPHAQIPISSELQEYTFSLCQQYGLSYELVLALMWRESLFTPDAVNVNTNGTRDTGLLQINDVNKSWLYQEHGIHDLTDPYQNIQAGTAILGGFMQKYGDETLALMAYQYGEAGMKRQLEKGVTSNEAIQRLMRKKIEFETLLLEV